MHKTPRTDLTSDGRTAFRVERDALGPVDVPAGAYFGAQTDRAVENLRISGVTIAQYPELIRALGCIKLAAARANRELGDLSSGKCSLIERACKDVISGALDDQFPIDVFQGGAGTSTTMAANCREQEARASAPSGE